MMKRLSGNFVVMLISAALTLLGVEVALRAALFHGGSTFNFLRLPQIYALYHHDDAEDYFNDDYWKLNYQFSGARGFDQPHPLLGWKGFFNDDYSHYDAYLVGAKRPVLLFGDSFVMCVDSTKCFEDQLNADTAFANGHTLLNYGVGGYGIDQIHLLMDQVVPMYEDPIVIFGMLTTDMDRCSLKFRDAQKPYFNLVDGQLNLQTTPIEVSTNEYLEDNPVEIQSYAVNLILNGLVWIFGEPNSMKQDHIDELRILNQAIISNQVNTLKDSETEFFGLLFQGVDQDENEWRNVFLQNLMDTLDVPFLSAKDLLRIDSENTGKPDNEYFIPVDQHPTSYYNRLVAMAIKNYVLHPDSRER